LDQDRATLIVTEPYAGTGLRQEIRDFHDQTTWKNRVAFITGSRNTYDQLIDTGKRLKAIQSILGDLESDKVPANDPQMIQASDLDERIQQNFYSAVRETFTVLWYPLPQGLVKAELSMNIKDSSIYYCGSEVTGL